jgi:Tol biopolymer transport system component
MMRILRGSSLLGLLFLLLLPAAVAAAAPPTFKGASADGTQLFFESEEQLVPGDTDGKRDVYVRAFDETVGEEGAYVTREVSVGPIGGNDNYPAIFEKASSDGKRVFFSTDEPLVAADQDRRADVYVREIGGSTKVVSSGTADCLPLCGNGTFDVGFAGASADGDEVLIVTAEQLDSAADHDETIDVYERDLATSTTTLVSTGEESCAPACGNGDFNATLRGVAPDGGRAFFATAEQLSAADDDAAIDIYARTLPNGPTALVSAGDSACAPCGNNGSAAIFARSSADGSRVFLATSEGLVPGDTDGANDIYLRHEGTTTLITAGTEAKPASFADASTDGTRVFFTTAEALVAGDENEATDVYLWEGAAPQLLTSGTCCGSNFGAATPDGAVIVFTTLEQLVPEDEDSAVDVYEQTVSGGVPRLASIGTVGGNGSSSARFNRVSADGDRVFFTTDEVLLPTDFDDDDDIYSRDLDAEETKLWTPPPGLCPSTSCDAILVETSGDGLHAVFQTEERLTAEDIDSEADVYERAYDEESETEVTRLVSTGNSSSLDLGPAPPQLTGTSPGSPGASTEPAVLGKAEGGSLIKVYSTSSCSGETVAAGTVEELESTGLRVGVPAGTTKTFWATAEAEGFTSLCSNPVSYTQQDPVGEPPPGETGSGGGPGSTTPPSEGGDKPPKTHDGVAYVKPLTKITYGPAAKTRKRRPVFRFADATGQPGTRFRCRVDRGRWTSCGSPVKLKRLSLGRHLFRVKGVNAVGTWDDRAAGRRFKVVAR